MLARTLGIHTWVELQPLAQSEREHLPPMTAAVGGLGGKVRRFDECSEKSLKATRNCSTIC